MGSAMLMMAFKLLWKDEIGEGNNVAAGRADTWCMHGAPGQTKQRVTSLGSDLSHDIPLFRVVRALRCQSRVPLNLELRTKLKASTTYSPDFDSSPCAFVSWSIDYLCNKSGQATCSQAPSHDAPPLLLVFHLALHTLTSPFRPSNFPETTPKLRLYAPCLPRTPSRPLRTPSRPPPSPAILCLM